MVGEKLVATHVRWSQGVDDFLNLLALRLILNREKQWSIDMPTFKYFIIECLRICKVLIYAFFLKVACFWLLAL